MAQVINTNVMSLTAQRNLNKSQSSMQVSLQRLSSGLRINSAKDDAAGLAISERMTTQIRGLNQAIRNASDGISLSQTAEGALDELNNNLQRIRELAVQSANATNSDSDRAALDAEVQQRLAEVDRIASQTSFNGRKVLDGSFGNAAFQVGSEVGQTISVNLATSMRQDSIGEITSATSVDLSTLIAEGTAGTAGSYTTGQLSSLDFSTAFAGGSNTQTAISTLDFSGGDGTFVVDAGGANTTVTLTGVAYANEGALVAKIQADLDGGTGNYTVASTGTVGGGDFNITITNDDTTTAVAISSANAAAQAAGFADSAGTAGTQTSNLVFDVDGNTVTVNSDHSGNLAALVSDIQGQLNTASAGTWTVAADGAAGFSITSIAEDATDPTVVDNFQTTSITGASGGTQVTAADAVAGSSLTLGANELQFTIGDGNQITVAAGTYTSMQSLVDAVNTALGSNATAELNATTNVMSFVSNEDVTIDTDTQSVFSAASFTAAGSLSTVNILDVSAANDAINRIDSALTTVSSLRSDFGAIQNRFESTIANLSTTSENIAASRSRIRDADFAAETAELTRTQILQQAGVAMLSQANSMPQSVLSLLQ